MGTSLEVCYRCSHSLRIATRLILEISQDCRTRLTTRTAHPTIDNPQLAISLLEKFSGLWVEPTLGEVCPFPSLRSTICRTPPISTTSTDA